MSFGKNRVALILFVTLLTLTGLTFALPAGPAAWGRASQALTAVVKRQQVRASNVAVAVAELRSNTSPLSNALAAFPTLGNYAAASVTVGGNTTVTPSAAPTDTTSATAAAPGFTGLLYVHPTTGVVSVNNAQPAGTYTVTVKAFGSGGSTTKTFTLTVTNPVAASITSFSGATDFGIGNFSFPLSVALGDFNGDGKLDFATTYVASRAVSIWLGNGAGGYTRAPDVSVSGNDLQSVALGDFNGDGKLDLAATDLYGTISIRLGDGAGGFSGSTNISASSFARGVALGDVNEDGNLDFAVNTGASTVSIRFGDGTGNFTSTANVSVGSGVRGMALGDVNKDGHLDLATANYTGIGNGTVSIRLGDGTGSFSGTTEVGVGSDPKSVVLGDFNEDGNLDFAVPNNESNTVSIRLGDGLGGFTGTTNVSVGAGPRSVALGDFNGDGKLDFAAANYHSYTVSIRLGDGLGGFTGTTSVSVGAGTSSVALGDVNGDGKLDIATANAAIYTVSIRLNTSSNSVPSITAGSTVNRTQGATASSATIATVSDAETAAASLTVTATTVPTGITVSNISNSNGTITANVAAVCSATAGNNTVVLTVTDGHAQTATANLTVNVASSAVSISTPPATQTVTTGSSVTFSVTATNAVSYQWRKGTTNIPNATASSYTINPVSSGDAGSYDVVVTGLCGNATSTAATLTVNSVPPTLGNYAAASVTVGGNTTVTPNAAPTDTTSATAAAPGFTGLLVVNPTTGVVSVNNAQPAGTYTVTVKAFGSGGSATKTFTLTVNHPATCTTTSFTGTTEVSVGNQPLSVALGDVNGDSKLDVAAANTGSTTVSIRLGDGAGGFTGTTNVSVGSTPYSVALGDVNGDGNLDVAAANVNSGTVSIRLGDGLGGFTGTTTVGVGSTPVSVALGDVNGDGKLDVATANAGNNTVSLRLGDGLGGFSGTTNVSVGDTPYSVVLGDVNGDGKLDLATANFGSTTVSLRLNSCTNNSAPSITAGSTVNRTQGVAASSATIATVSDTETAAGSLTVTATTVPTGITISSISNSNGTITANVAADCTATPGANTVVLTVTDGGGATATANLTVNVVSSAVSISTPPTAQTVTAGGSVTFSVTATNATGYQWRKGTTNIPGATASSYTINPVSSGDAGSYDVVVTGVCGNATSNAATLTVNQAAQTITFGALASKTWGDAAFTVSATASSNLPVSYSVASGPATINGNTVTITGAGTVTIRASQAGDGNYNAATAVDQAFTVNKATLTVTAAAQTKVYGAANPALTFSYSGFVNNETANVLTGTPSVTTAATTTSGVGSHTITAAVGTLVASNYQFSFVPGSLMVTPATLTVTADNQTRTYGAANPTLTASYSGFVNSDTASVLTGSPALSTAATTTSGVGGYAITAAAGTLSASNYNFSFAPGTLTVNKAPLSIKADDVAKAYGVANPTLTGQIAGLQNNDAITASYATTATETSVVGSYPITVSLNDPNGRSGNYEVQLVNGTLTIGKSLLTITADEKTKVYGAANPALTFHVSGFKNGETISTLTGMPTLTTTATSGSHVGSYPISVAAGTLSATNYDFTLVAGNLTVTPAPLTVTAESATRAYGTANPRLMVSFNGLVNGDTMNLTSGTVALATAVQPNSPAGSYPIVPSGLTNPDYTITYVPGTLTVTPVAVALALTASHAPSALGQTVTFTASAQATTPYGGMPGGAITFTVDGKALSPFVLNAAGQASFTSCALGLGAHTITVSYGGDNNYLTGTKDLAQEVSKALSYTTLTTTANLISTGQRLMLTAKVRGNASQPQGEVEFFADGNSLGRVALANGVASFTMPELTAGDHALEAVYLGDATAASSRATMTQAVTEDCVFLISQKEILVEPQGGKLVVEMSTRGGCAWTVGGQPAWIDLWSPDLINGQWVITMVVAPHTGPNVRTAKIRLGDQDVTITQSRPMAAVQAATYGAQGLAGDTLASIFGTNLASGVASATTQPLPTLLGGVRVKLRDRQGNEAWAALLYVSPTQINFVVPTGLVEGEVVVSVVRDDLETSASKFALETVVPGLFSADSTGSGLAAGQIQRVRPDGSHSLTEVAQYNPVRQGYDYQPILLNTSTSLTSDEVYLVLYGTGLRHRTSLQNMCAHIGNQDAQVVYAAAQSQFAGLDQINILIPQSLAGAGLVDVVLTIDGKASNTVKIFIQ